MRLLLLRWIRAWGKVKIFSLMLCTGILKSMGPMLAEIDLSQLFLVCGEYYWNTWLCARIFHIIDAKCATFMTLLLFVTNRLSYTQKESHLVRDGLETQTLKWETHSDSSEIISWHGRECSNGISLPQWPIRLWIYFQMVSEHLSSCQHIKPVPEPVDVNMSLSIHSSQFWSYPWKVETS